MCQKLCLETLSTDKCRRFNMTVIPKPFDKTIQVFKFVGKLIIYIVQKMRRYYVICRRFVGQSKIVTAVLNLKHILKVVQFFQSFCSFGMLVNTCKIKKISKQVCIKNLLPCKNIMKTPNPIFFSVRLPNDQMPIHECISYHDLQNTESLLTVD